MVCAYCAGRTKVTNSRKQSRSNSVWRRRACLVCQAVFTSVEAIDSQASYLVAGQDNQLAPFSRLKLEASLLGSLAKKDVKSCLAASELAHTVVNKCLIGKQASVTSQQIAITAAKVLKQYNRAAHLRYVLAHEELLDRQIKLSA